MQEIQVIYDARPLQPRTRHWGPGIVVQSIIGRLSAEFRFVGLSHKFQPPNGLDIKAWPSVRKLGMLSFEVSPIFAPPADVYWGTNHQLPQSLRKPSVVTVHDLLFLNAMDSAGGLLARLRGNRFVSSVRRADRIITDSRTTADDLLSLFPEIGRKTEVGLLGFDKPTSGNGSRGEGQCPADHYVVMLGCHAPRKNLPLALAAVDQVNVTGAKVSLCITGNIDPLFEPLVRRNPSLVLGLGVLPKEDVFRLLQSAVALLFTSRYEGFGFPLLEGMAAGCPVLALDTPINREIAGDGAWLLEDSPQQWAHAIKTLMNSSSARAELRGRGCENLKRFSWETTANVYGEVFRKVAR